MIKLIPKQSSEKLRLKLDDVVKYFQNCATIVSEAFTLGLEEGYSHKEIGLIIREKLLQLGYDSRSILRVLPPSAKDLSKTRKDYRRDQVNSNAQPDEDIMSSSKNCCNYDENQRAVTVDAQQIKIDTLENKLKEEQAKNEDLTIQIKNASLTNTQLRVQLQAALNTTSKLLISREMFPLNFGQVFESQDHVFVVEFKGTKILDITVISQRQAYNQDVMRSR